MMNEPFFEEQIADLTGLASRMLGSIADAEDVVQETFLHWRRTGEPDLENPRRNSVRPASVVMVGFSLRLQSTA